MREVGERLPRGAAGGWWVVGGCDVNVSGVFFCQLVYTIPKFSRS